MKNNRSLIDGESLIRRWHLNTNLPPPDSLFWRMWHASCAVAQRALETDFLQGIKEGILDPMIYGAFNISDIYYCHRSAEDYGRAAERTTNIVLKDYLRQKQSSYEHYNRTLCARWNLAGPHSIVPTATALGYTEFETAVANGTSKEGDVRDPIYALVVMIPCEYLWAWLAAKLTPPSPGNIYANWVTSNNDPKGSYAMGNFLETYISQQPIDESLATKIYQTAVEFEYNNFRTACDHLPRSSSASVGA